MNTVTKSKAANKAVTMTKSPLRKSGAEYERDIDLTTKTGMAYEALVLKGEALSAQSLTKRFGIKNPRATISDIRAKGFVINVTHRKTKNGLVTEYVHGTPSRELVALGYKAMNSAIKTN